jgi:CBS domain containing-hemolysin-like protein
MVTALAAIALGIVVVLAITAFTGYFVAQEFAYMAVDRSRLKARAQAGDTAAERALGVTKRTSFMLSGAQLGITVTGLLVGYVAEPLIGQGVGTLLGGVSVPTGIGVAVGAVVAIVFSTLVQMLFGELFPKNLAIARPEPVARALALSTTWYLRLFGWLIWLFDQSSNLLLRALRIEPVHDVEHSATPKDLEHIVAASRDAGELPPDLSALLDRTLDFPTRSAEHAMIPRSRVDVISADKPADEVLALMAQGHTRYPVVGEDVDDLRGVVHMLDLLDAAAPGGTAGSRCRPAVIVPTAMPLPSVLQALRAADDEMALVIDEYGGFAGVVTIEDMAEELVGEIDDEHDADVDDDAVAEGDGWLMPGDTPLDEVHRMFDRLLPEGDYETIAGLAIAEAGGLPAVGDTVSVVLEPEAEDLVADEPQPQDLLTIEIRAVDKHVPSQVFVAVRAEEVQR